jgi:hypothetical protein
MLSSEGLSVPGAGGAAPRCLRSEAVFDAPTFISGARVTYEGTGNLDLLPALIDPRGWTRAPFWLAADRVELVDGSFVRCPDDPPLGEAWKGYLYECMVLPENGCITSAFQVYLNVDFRVPKRDDAWVVLRYSLFQASGNMQLMRVAAGGLEIDRGFAEVKVLTPIEGSSRGESRVAYTVQKSVRYSSILSRSTPGQGPPGAGSVLNMNASAILAVWIEELTRGTMAEWQRRSRSQSSGGVR